VADALVRGTVRARASRRRDATAIGGQCKGATGRAAAPCPGWRRGPLVRCGLCRDALNRDAEMPRLVDKVIGEGRGAGPGRRRYAGAKAIDPGRPQGRLKACGYRTGIPALAAGRPTCYHRRAARPAQDGAVDGSTPQADSDIREFEPPRLRFDDGVRLPAARRSREITAGQGASAEMPTSDRAMEHDPQTCKHQLSQIALVASAGA